MTRRRGRIAAPSAAAGACLALSLPPAGWWPLAFVGAGILAWRLDRLRARARLLAGWTCGLGCFVPGLAWSVSFNWYGAAILMAVEALSMGLAAMAVPPRCHGWARLAACTGAFTLAEAVRLRWPLGGLPLGGVFLGQGNGPLLGTARLGGPLLLTACVWATGAALADAGAAAAARRAAARLARSPAVAVPLALVVLAAVGDAAPDGGPAARTVRVAAVQGGGPRGIDGPSPDPVAVLRAQLAASSTLARPARRGQVPALVVWPEDTVAITGPLRTSPAVHRVADLARRLGTTLVVGVTDTVSARAFRNEVTVFGPAGRVVATYEKVHRVPFGEYVPWRAELAHFANLSRVPLDAIAGTGTGLLRTPAGPLGALVSFETFFAGRGRAAVGAGARLLVVPTNTASYASDQVPSQELAADRVQAVDTGRDLVQASTTGYSAIVDHRGTVRLRSVLGRRQVLVATVALRRGWTPYQLAGDLPVLLLAGAALAGAWLAAGRPDILARRVRAATSRAVRRWRDRSHRAGAAVVGEPGVTRSSPSGCRRTARPRPRTWRGWRDRPRGPDERRSRSGAAAGRRPA
ncbi:MAG TPA: apolipoprotein N-acyltransferase [Acidimicrobiales bacterium]|nr:apolipoprotein N-acyltransferase [Acidimicrobiales bacterium]